MERKVYDQMAQLDSRHWWFTARRRILDAIIERVGRVVAGGRTAFVDGSPTYDAASMAVIRLAGLFEVRRFGPFLAGVAPGEQRSIKTTRQYAALRGYREMDDDEFWDTVTIDIPGLVDRLRISQ